MATEKIDGIIGDMRKTFDALIFENLKNKMPTRNNFVIATIYTNTAEYYWVVTMNF